MNRPSVDMSDSVTTPSTTFPNPAGDMRDTSNLGATKAANSQVRWANISNVFGSGAGRLTLIAGAIFLVIGGAVAYRTLNTTAKEKTTTVDVPQAQQVNENGKPISLEEAARRSQMDASLAADAANNNATYQAQLNPNAPTANGVIAIQPNAQFDVNGNLIQLSPEDQAKLAARQAIADGQPPPPTIQIGNGNRQQANPYPTQQNPSSANVSANNANNSQNGSNAYQTAIADRDKYETETRAAVLNKINEYLASNANPKSSYGFVSYAPKVTQASQTNGGSSATGTPTATTKPVLIKAGNILTAGLDSAANTDDGSQIIATIYGGEWDGARLIGSIEQGNDNIRFKFTTLAPQDGRPTMTINAIALRASDLSVGMAEIKNHHTFSRWTSLAASSLLSGYGQVASTIAGSTVTNGNTTTSTTQTPTDKQVIAGALGELGTNASAIAKQGFARPHTYSTPAGTTFALVFLSDAS